MKLKGIVKALVMLMFLVMIPAGVYANSEQGNRGRMQGPPPEAIKACTGKQVGDTVSFKGRRGETLNATCQTVEDQLVAVPEGHKPRQ